MSALDLSLPPPPRDRGLLGDLPWKSQPSSGKWRGAGEDGGGVGWILANRPREQERESSLGSVSGWGGYSQATGHEPQDK